MSDRAHETSAGSAPREAVVGSLDAIDGRPLAEGVSWLPVRAELGIDAIGVNGFRAERAGVDVIEAHDETSQGAAGHDELYLVTAGRATFTVAGTDHVVTVGGLVHVPVGVARRAVADEPGTVVLAVGASPGAAGSVSAWERWTRAYALRDGGDHDAAIAELEAGFADHPGHPLLHYHLACMLVAVDRTDEARRHLEAAYVGDPRTVEWARADDDLAPLRDR